MHLIVYIIKTSSINENVTLSCVSILVIIFYIISKIKCHETHIRYYSAKDSRYDRTEFLALDLGTGSDFFPYKSGCKIVTACRELQGK
jgi:hypothetical protein